MLKHYGGGLTGSLRLIELVNVLEIDEPKPFTSDLTSISFDFILTELKAFLMGLFSNMDVFFIFLNNTLIILIMQIVI